MNISFGSLFSGIGGLDLGLERAGMTCKWQVEIDPFCQKVLAKHWPEVPKYGDIRDVTGEQLGYVDLIAGGFPCQDLSLAGKRVGIKGARSGLWAEFARLLGIVRPRWVLIENVPGLLDNRAMSRVLGDLSALGFDALWQSVRASDLGASHKRERIFIVAYDLQQRCGEAGELRHGEVAGISGFGDELAYAGHRGEFDGSRSARREAGEWKPERGEFGIDQFSMENAGFTGERRPAQPASVDRQRASGDDCGTSGTLGDSELSRCDRGPREGLHADGRPLQASRSGDPDAGVVSIAIGAGLQDSESKELQGERRRNEGRATAELYRAPFPFAPGPADRRWAGIIRGRADLAPSIATAGRGKEATESEVLRVADGLSDLLDRAMSNRTKRLGKIGNAVVPQVAEWIGRRIVEVGR